jgi:hypothetical protein
MFKEKINGLKEMVTDFEHVLVTMAALCWVPMIYGMLTDHAACTVLFAYLHYRLVEVQRS